MFRKLLFLLHRTDIHQLYANLRMSLWSLGPHGEAVVGTLFDSDAEESLVHQSCTTLLMVGCTEHHIVGTALKGPVIPHLDTSEDRPPHQVLRKLKRAVFHQLAVESAVGSIVDILEKDAIHGFLYLCSHLLGIHVHHVLGFCRHDGHCQQGEYCASFHCLLIMCLLSAHTIPNIWA